MTPKPEIEPSAVRLRAIEKHDGTAIERICSDWRVARMLAVVPHPYPAGGGQRYVEEMLVQGPSYRQLWAIAVGDDAVFAGAVGLRFAEGVYRLGYYLAPDLWGQGITSRAVAAALEHGFANPSIDAVHAYVFADNPASARLLVKLGFLESGRSEDPCLARGHDVMSIWYRLDRSAWEARA